jgi:hypothetical protein
MLQDDNSPVVMDHTSYDDKFNSLPASDLCVDVEDEQSTDLINSSINTGK